MYLFCFGKHGQTSRKQESETFQTGGKNTNSLSKRSLSRSHPVSANSGFPMLSGVVLTEERGVAAGLVEEEEDADGVEDICAAATSAAWTLGSRKQKERGLAFWMRQPSRPVCWVPRGDESAWHFCRARPVLGRSGRITLQLAWGCCREAQTHGCELACCRSFLDFCWYPQNKQPPGVWNPGRNTVAVNSAAVKWYFLIKTHWTH